MNLRVLYLIDSLGRGGAESLLADSLPHLARLGIRPEVVALQDKGGNPVAGRIRDAGFPVADLGIARLRQPGAYRRVAAAVDAARPDVVHTQLQFADILGTLAAYRRRIPSLSTLHTLEAPEGASRESWRRRLAATVLRRLAARVIAVSDDARRHAVARLGLPPGLVKTIHNGIETERFTPEPAWRNRIRGELGIDAEAPVVATVAVLREPKGIQDALRGLPRVLERVPNAHYLVVGDGPYREELEHLAAVLGLGGAVTFAGHRNDIAHVLAAADLFLLPSHTEALPTVVAEAMAAGLPVVATTVGGIPEMVDPDAGILIPPGRIAAVAEAVAELLGDPHRRRVAGGRASTIATERFELRTQTGLIAAEYRSLASRGVEAAA
jgi:glycosyltransferase involved in cell wall biosynthesis